MTQPVLQIRVFPDVNERVLAVESKITAEWQSSGFEIQRLRLLRMQMIRSRI